MVENICNVNIIRKNTNNVKNLVEKIHNVENVCEKIPNKKIALKNMQNVNNKVENMHNVENVVKIYLMWKICWKVAPKNICLWSVSIVFLIAPKTFRPGSVTIIRFFFSADF